MITIRKIADWLGSFGTNDRGNVLVMGGILAPSVFFAAMLAVDYSNVSRIGTRVQSSLDAAVLAAAVEANNLDEDMTQEERETYLKDYIHTFFNANFTTAMGGNMDAVDFSDFNFVLSLEDNVVDVKVGYEYKTVGLSLFNHETIEFDKGSSSVLEVVAEHYVIDIVMCLDATGSMQDTLDAVKAQAVSFSGDLRTELGASADNIKIRVRPIFYRDWEDHVMEHNLPRYHSWAWYVPSYWNYYKNLHGNQYEGGLIESDFIDLNPSAQSGLNEADQNEAFEDFAGSESAVGGWNWPEAAGACLNEGIRSDWFDVTSQESYDYFDIDASNTIIQDGDPEPTGTDWAKVSVVPVIAFWTDATINSLSLSETYISDTMPTSYSDFEDLWNDATYINQDRKILIHFGPGSGSGWNTIKNWDSYAYGGDLDTGNEEGVKTIAEIIKETVPEVLRLAK